MHLIRDIDQDETKQLLYKAMADFGRNVGIQLVAKGIETEEELRTLINLNVDFDIAHLKKKCKRQPGNYMEVI